LFFWTFIQQGTTLFSDAIFAITALTILGGTYFAWRQLKQSRTGQSLKTLSDLNQIYSEPGITEIRARIFQKKQVYFSEFTKFSNFLDGVGHMVFHLPDDDQKIALEQWAETFVRCWIRMGELVYQKRPISIGRDYVYFEWLASKSRELMKETIGGNGIKISFYEFTNLGYKTLETYKYHEKGFVDENGNCLIFKDSENIKKDFNLKK
jgi:hypothetical protein